MRQAALGAVLVGVLVLLVYVLRPDDHTQHVHPLTAPAFRLGQTWIYDVTENFTSPYTTRPSAWTASLQVLQTDVHSATGDAALILDQGAAMTALLGRDAADEAQDSSYAVIDPDEWTWVGIGYYDQAADRPDPHSYPPQGTIVPDACDGQLLFAPSKSASVKLAPDQALSSGTWTGVWSYDGLAWNVTLEHIESSRVPWNGSKVLVHHLHARLSSPFDDQYSVIDYWFAPALDGVLKAQRHTVRPHAASDVIIDATMVLRDYRVAEVQRENITQPSTPPPQIGTLRVQVDGDDPVALGDGPQTRHARLVDGDGRGWKPAGLPVDVAWSLVYGRETVVNESRGESADFVLEAPGSYLVYARPFLTRCFPDQTGVQVGTFGQLGLVSRSIPVAWTQQWVVNVNPGFDQDIVVDDLEVPSGARTVSSEAFWIPGPASTGPSDGYEVRYRTEVNNDITPDPALPEGVYEIIWHAQGTAGRPVVGDDWQLSVTLEF